MTGEAPETDEGNGDVPEEGPDIPEKELPEEKMGLGFYAAFGLVLLLVLIIVVGNYSVIRPDAGSELTRTNWTLQYLQDKTGIVVPVQSGSKVTAQFGRDGRVSGYSGCNHYTSTYTANDHSITATTESVTQILCWGPGVMEQESAYLADLSAVSSWRTGGSDLYLADASGRTVLVFNAE
jgi:heat shock protein HslJ